MARIRYTRGAILKGEMMGPGDEVEVSDRDAHLIVMGYRDAVYIAAEPPPPTSNTVRDQLQMQEPAVAHRDPVVKPAQRNR